jgi:hypothetical protein
MNEGYSERTKSRSEKLALLQKHGLCQWRVDWEAAWFDELGENLRAML